MPFLRKLLSKDSVEKMTTERLAGQLRLDAVHSIRSGLDRRQQATSLSDLAAATEQTPAPRREENYSFHLRPLLEPVKRKPVGEK